MHKIVKHYGVHDSPVTINNSVYSLSSEESKLTADERKQLEIDKKAAEEKAFSDAVAAETEKILAIRSAELESQRIKIIESAKREANSISSDAKAATISVFEKTTKECAMLKAQAETEGHKKGYEAGHKEAVDKYKKYVEGAAKLMADINSKKEAYYISNEKELKETLFMMVEKIVRAELEVNPLIIERIIADAARNFRNSDYIKISIAGGEIVSKMKTDKKFINKIIPGIKDIEIEILDDAPEGTVILDDDQNIVDASVPTQLDFLKEILKNTRGGEQ